MHGSAFKALQQMSIILLDFLDLRVVQWSKMHPIFRGSLTENRQWSVVQESVIDPQLSGWSFPILSIKALLANLLA